MSQTTATIDAAIISQVEAAIGQSIPLLPRAFIRVLSRALAGVVVLLYKYIGFMALQLFVRTASFTETIINGQAIRPLVEWGRLVGIGDPAPATPSELSIQIYVTAQGGTLPAGTQLTSADGAIYLLLADRALNAATVATTVRAVDGGAVGNLAPGAPISFVNPLAGVARAAVVLSTPVTGADAETEQAYRQRVVDRFQKRPQGGAYADYEAWAEEPAGVLRAYPYTSDCPGMVDVYIESATEADGIPTTEQLQEALDAINQAYRRPATAVANTYPITRTAFTVEVTGLSDDTAQASITSELGAWFLLREPYIPGLSVPPRFDRVTAAAVAGVVDEAAAAAGATVDSVRVLVTLVGVTAYTLGAGEKAKLGAVNFV